MNLPRPSPRATSSLVRRTLGGLALLAATVLCGILAHQLWWTEIRATESSAEIVTELRDSFDQVSSGPSPSPGEALQAATPPAGAIVHLPTIGEVHPVLPGIGVDVLDLGVLGRYPGSADPGTIGNFAVAGHRTTYGRPLWALDQLSSGDPVVVETADSYHVYLIDGHRVVGPDDTTVLAPAPDRPGVPATAASMVLTTCHPLFSARQRLIGYAVLDRSVPRAEGPPPEIGAATS